MFYFVGALIYTFIYTVVLALGLNEKSKPEIFGGAALIWLLTTLVWPFSLVALAAWVLVLTIKGKKNGKVSLKK